MPTLPAKVRYLFIALLAVTVLPAPRCGEVDGLSGKSGSSKNIKVVPGSGSNWATGSLPQSAAEVPSCFIDLVNNYRAARGLSALTYHDGLSLGLRRHQQDMDQDNYFGLFNPNNGIDVPTRLVSSTPRIDFDNVSHFLLRGSVAPDCQTAFNILINDRFFVETLLDPTATHIGGYKQGHFQVIIGYNVIPSRFDVPSPPPPAPPTPPVPVPSSSSGGGGGGGGSIITGVRIITIRI